LTDMKDAYNKAKALEERDVTTDLKARVWQEFVNSFKTDNPYSQEDDTMRQSARKQLEYWKNQPSETKPTITTGGQTIIGKDGAEMVLIPAGEFQMGDNYFIDAEVHTVYLDAFYIDKYEVTNAQYKKFMDATGHKAPKYWNDANYNKPNHPVVGVDWNDASAYCSWAGKRLPTEAEWEKSARGGLVGKKYVWGDEWSPPSKAGNFDDETTVDSSRISGYSDGYVWTSPVGSFKPNGYGLYDMAGNVWEWVADWYDRNYYSSSPKSNPTGPSSGSSRVLRGGSWDDADDYDLRVAYRDLYVPTSNGSHVGFRGAGLVR